MSWSQLWWNLTTKYNRCFKDVPQERCWRKPDVHNNQQMTFQRCPKDVSKEVPSWMMLENVYRSTQASFLDKFNNFGHNIRLNNVLAKYLALYNIWGIMLKLDIQTQYLTLIYKKLIFLKVFRNSTSYWLRILANVLNTQDFFWCSGLRFGLKIRTNQEILFQ